MTYDMEATIVEATSLSRVTNIATSPPAHPNSPTDIPKLPLVLYIARVPGSRDVFLTPIKPREKVVTAEDVQSSLYYVHVNSHEDFEEPPLNSFSIHPEISHWSLAGDDEIRRKPALPARPNAPGTQPYPQVDEKLYTQHKPRLPARKQISRKPVNAPVSVSQTLDLPVLPSRPLPTPPADEATSLHTENMRLLRKSDDSEENNPYIRRYEPSPQPMDPADMPEPGSLTLIRRDPSSNEQWNVASIHDPPIHEVSSTALLNPSAAKRTKRGGAPLYLDIANSAYMQFIGNERSQPRFSTSSSASSDSDPPPEGIFRRRLYMPASRYGEHRYGHSRNLSSVDSSSQDGDEFMRRTMRSSSNMSNDSPAPVSDRRSKGYTFTSPWGGRCEFSTGATGKSLKCKHYLSARQGGTVAEVSELRFNLPTSQTKMATTLSEKRSSYFHRMHGRSPSAQGGDEDTPKFVIDNDGRIDLTLGQERAGGGFGGKQAKLGKLIIEPEGLKMLDLLVSANIGLWWRAYERS